MQVQNIAPFGMEQSCQTCSRNSVNNMFNDDPFSYCTYKLYMVRENDDKREWDDIKSELDISNCQLCEKYMKYDEMIPNMIYIHDIDDLMKLHISYLNNEYYVGVRVSNSDEEDAMLQYMHESDDFYDEDSNYDGDYDKLFNAFKSKLSEQYTEFPAVAFVYCEKGFDRSEYKMDMFVITPISQMANYKVR